VTAINSAATMYAALRNTAATHPHRLAVVAGPESVTYSTLVERIDANAAVLASRGVKESAAVAILFPNSIDFVVSWFAVSSLGAIVVPLNEHYQASELEFILPACGIQLLLTNAEHHQACESMLRATGTACVALEFRWNVPPAGMRHPAGVPEPAQSSTDAPAMFQFSSGSTGRPKRIARTHRQLLTELQSLVEALSIKPNDRFLGAAPFSHVNGLMRSMMACLIGGGTLYPVSRFARSAIVELIEQQQLTMFVGVPFMFSMLAKSHFPTRPSFASLRHAISASAPMPVAMNRMFHERFGLYVRQLYGSTETGTISVNLSEDIAGSLESVGTTIPGVTVDLFDDSGVAVRPGADGEVAVRSAHAVTRYEEPVEAIEAFRGGYFFTGDLGRRDSAGRLYLIGRKKWFINKGGYKINPAEIEELLSTHPAVHEAVVLGVPTQYGDERVQAVVVADEGCTVEQLMEHCRGRIADFKIPSVVEFRESLPRSATGKVRRALLYPGMGNDGS